jgi:hypothetical protein
VLHVLRLLARGSIMCRTLEAIVFASVLVLVFAPLQKLVQPGIINLMDSIVKMLQARLPTHLAHAFKDNRAVVIHALGSSL